MKRLLISVIPVLLALAGCATEADLKSISAHARIPKECTFIDHTPEVAVLGTDENTVKIVDALGGGEGNLIVKTGGTVYGGLMALGNTWYGDLYECDDPNLYRDGYGVIVVDELRQKVEAKKAKKAQKMKP